MGWWKHYVYKSQKFTPNCSAEHMAFGWKVFSKWNNLAVADSILTPGQ